VTATLAPPDHRFVPSTIPGRVRCDHVEVHGNYGVPCDRPADDHPDVPASPGPRPER
jgi:hypothetical protein